ncbi:hypothetical protein [Stenotrophomonas sp. PS02289]|uniref:hypothetical protein n=1 Tax=Stenotrophomonas sp. PS02289 TaxID=2991422 RepID=UPI002499DD9A|nr:hypothetical protein [Stenotrophomonas sp. PS02289]
MMKFIADLLFPRRRLSELELLILNAVRARLEPDVQPLWDKQVASINRVERLQEGVEADFFRMRGGKVFHDPEIAFPNRTKELHLAAVAVSTMSYVLKAEVWSVGGHLFCIEYSGGAGYFEEALGMNPLPDFDVQCALLADISSRTGLADE